MTGSKTWSRPAQPRRRALDKVADGRVFTGRQALELKLIDELGDEKAAIAWLRARRRKIDPKTPVRNYRLSSRFCDLRSCTPRWSACSMRWGLARWPSGLKQWGAFAAVERLNLDGLLALWHPPTTN